MECWGGGGKVSAHVLFMIRRSTEGAVKANTVLLDAGGDLHVLFVVEFFEAVIQTTA
jgi:hypothetical protein